MAPPLVKRVAKSVGVTRRPSGTTALLLLAATLLPVITGAALAAALLVSASYLVVALVAGVLWILVERDRRRRRARAVQRQLAAAGSPGLAGTSAKRSTGAAAASRPEPVGDFAAGLLAEAGPEHPLLTVVIPLHNKQVYFKDCLQSLLEQSFTHWRCVIVDDGSTDNSLDVARGVADRDPRFEILISPTASGASEARNAGLAATTTPYVTFLDADDALLADSLLSRVCALTDDPLQAGTYSEWASFADGADWRHLELEPVSVRTVKDYVTMGWDSPCIVTAPLFRTDVVMACGGFDARLTTAEDMDFFGRLLRSGYHLNCSGTRDVLYRTVPGSLLLANAHQHWEAVVEIARWRDAPWIAPDDAPMPFTAPLSDYRREADLMDRALSNLAIALAAGCTDDELNWWRAAFEKFPRELRTRAALPILARQRSWSGLLRASGGVRPNKRQVRELTAEMVSVARWGLSQESGAGQTAQASQTQTRVVSRPDYTLKPGVDLRPLSEVDTGAPLVLVKADARYHVYETGPLVLELRRRGVNAQPFMQKAAYSDRRQLVDWSRYVDAVYTGTDEDLAATEVVGAIVLNDWSPSARAMMDATKRAGGLTFAKVEGVQDFEDADTGRQRHAYRSADVILAQGINDVEALPGMDVEIVGSSRLEQIWAEPPVARRSDRVLLNVNFTYGVLTDAFRGWLDGAVDVMEQEGLEGDISAHWAQKDMPKDPRIASLVRPQPFRYLITQAGVLVSRFSTVPFEAMARGIPFVYFNPHGERVPTFTKPNGAFEIVTEYADLGRVLRAELAFDGDYRARSAEFFLRQVDVDARRSSAERAADVICQRLGLPHEGASVTP